MSMNPAVAFTFNSPRVANSVGAIVPHLDRLLSNCASLADATAVLAVCFQLDLEPAEAGHRVRLSLELLAATALGMAVLFTYEQMIGPSPQVHALHLLLFIVYLGFAIIDFAQQTLRQSRTTRRRSVQLGLRLTAAGCAFALMYTAYKLTVLVTLGLNLHPVPDDTDCSSLITTPCLFGVTFPVLSILLLCIGLTLPAVAYPIAQAQRHRWETRSFDALGPLWQDLSAAMPTIVLPAARHDQNSAADDADFLLQRRVVEISDGILARRPYRSQKVLETVQRTTEAGTEEHAAIVEAAVVKAALAAMKAGRLADEVAGPSAEAASRKDLRGDTQWLLQVADAYAHRTARVTDDQTPVGA
ncbi:hypothetical protein OG896_38450 [Streptomyces sp. NBC_00669]